MKKYDIYDKTFQFSVDNVRLCNHLFKYRDARTVIARQLVRSGTSIGANLEEGQAAHSRPDFIFKLTIALKEARESHYWSKLLKVTASEHKDEIDPLIRQVKELIAILTTIIKNTKQNNKTNK